jgi:kanamycin kinase
MTDSFAHLAALHRPGPGPVPDAVLRVAAHDGADCELVWRNDLGGLTFRLLGRRAERYVKWNPRTTGIDLDRERVRLEWLSGRHPVPCVLEHGSDETAQWLVTAALPGSHAVGDEWRARRPEAIRAIAAGLRALHAIPVGTVPAALAATSWPARVPANLGPRPPVDRLVVVHGDACAPNTLVGEDGSWTGHVDLGDLGVGDPWADLAVASLSLDWNFGEGHQGELFDAYGIERDEERIRYYRALWQQES